MAEQGGLRDTEEVRSRVKDTGSSGRKAGAEGMAGQDKAGQGMVA